MKPQANRLFSILTQKELFDYTNGRLNLDEDLSIDEIKWNAMKLMINWTSKRESNLMKNSLPELKMDKSTLTFSTLDEPSDDKAYWLSKTPLERLEALELMRQIVYGYDDANPPRLQRVLEIAQR